MKIPLKTSPGRLMGLDVGARSIGIAISDPLRISVRPLMTLQRTDLGSDCDRLLTLARNEDVHGMVVGRPSNMDGSRSPTLGLVTPLVKRLREAGIPIAMQDERLSTKTADANMARAKLPIAERRRRRNEFAAAVILEWYLQER